MITRRTEKAHELAQHAQRSLLRAWSKLIEALERHPRIAAVLVVVLGGLGFVAAPVYADSGILNILTGTLTATVLGPIFLAIGGLLYIFVTLAMLINTLLAWLLVSFASYNNFVQATPVTIGWPLVRDVVNMFFIVVLLVVAFSTIIGYQEFHYKKVLPKLLLMVVLINFSKTLVGIMIDFSQVITLTFVNGFKQAAFGNFVKAFGISQMLNVATQTGNSIAQGGGAAAQTMEQVIASLLFDVVILSVTATVLLIMCIYFVVRIVLLWMLLIFSPIAFFGLALPGKMQKAISALTSDWWSRLGSLLTGGPIVAFFLWLTLAVVQSSATPFSALYSPTSSTESTSLSPTISQVSDPSNVTTMIVAIIMLLTGLNTAVAVSKAAAPQLGKVAESIRSSGGPVGTIARGARRATGAAARAGGSAALAAAGYADRRYNITGNVGQRLVQSGQQTAARGGLLNAVTGAALGTAGARALGVGARGRAQITRGFEEQTKHLSPPLKLDALGTQIALAESTGNRRAADVLTVQKGLIMKDGATIKARSKTYEDEYMARPREAGDTEEQQLVKAKAYGEGRAKREAGDAIGAAIKAAEAQGNTSVADQLKEVQSKDPSFQSDFNALSKLASNKIDDYKQEFKNVKTEGWQDSGTFLAYMKAAGLVDDRSGKMVDGYKDTDAWKELTSASGGNRTKYVQAQVKNMESPEGQQNARLQLAAMAEGANQDLINQAQAVRQSVSLRGDQVAYANVAPNGAVALKSADDVFERARPVAGFEDFARNLSGDTREGMRQALEAAGLTGDRLQELMRRQSRGATPENAAFMRQPDVARAYAAPPAYRAADAPPGTPAQEADRARSVQILAQGQAMGIAPPPQAQRVVVEYAAAQAGAGNVGEAQAAQIYSNINTNDIVDNAAIREAVTDALSGKLDQFAAAYTSSKSNPDTMKKMEGVVNTIKKQADKAVAAAAATGGGLSAVDAKLVNLSEEMKKQTVLKKIGDRSRKTT